MERAVEREWNENAWRGSPGDIADLTAEVAHLVRQASKDDDEPSAHISVRLAGDAGEFVFDTIADFQDFARDRSATLAQARIFYAAIGHQINDVGVTLIIRRYWFLASAVSAAVRGRSAVAVNGVTPEVKAILHTAGQPVSSWAIYLGVWVVGLLLALAAFPVSGPAAETLRVAGTTLMLAAVAFGVLSPFLWPQFEVSDPGAPKRGAARVRAGLAGSGKWLLVAVAGAVIYAVIDRLIGGA